MHPVRQRSATHSNTGRLHPLVLAIKRKVITKFVDQHARKQTHIGVALLEYRRRRLRASDLAVVSTFDHLAHCLDDLVRGGLLRKLMRDALGEKEYFFDFVGFRVIVEKRSEDEEPISEATVKIRVNGVLEVTAAEGTGPVNALDKAIKKALGKFYPELENVSLFDYKVRILDEKKGTQAKTRVLVESGDHNSKWGTVGVSENIIEASWQALIDSLEYKLNAFSKNPRGR